eukprot:2300380-Ditylum_brightwellii.AAC.1
MVSDQCCDTILPWMDVKANVMLCVGGACTYIWKEGNGVIEPWICQYVYPCIRTVYGKEITTLVGKVVMWAIFDSNFQELVPQSWHHLAVADYNNTPSYHCIAGSEIPVEKCCLVVWEYGLI